MMLLMFFLLSRLAHCAYLMSHRIRVHLAHVAAGVVELHVRDVQLPRVVPVVGDG